MKSVFLMLAGVAIFVIVAGIITQGFPEGKFGPFKTSKNEKVTLTLAPEPKVVTVNGMDIEVTIANEPNERSKGLSGTKDLEGKGMLFVFEEMDVSPTFWMKDMLINIDIVWINDGLVVQIDENVKAPDPNTADKDLKLYPPSQKIDYVLEVTSGFTSEKGIEVGDTVDLSQAL